jgi:hypothetical protein
VSGNSHLQNCSELSHLRVAAGAFGFLTLTQVFDKPNLQGAPHHDDTSSFLWEGGVSQTPQTDSQGHLIHPLCLLGCNAPMALTHTEDEYPGYQRRTFTCPDCGDTMTQWTGVSLASAKKN